MTKLTHRDCSGPLVYDPSRQYEQYGEPGDVTMPAVRCTRCGREVLGDAEIVLPVEMHDVYVEVKHGDC